MLQESSEQRIEFLHNTLKEFLAAERFFNAGNVGVLADHAEEAAWQPVILFSLALPRDGSSFATDLIRAILEKTTLAAPEKGQSKQAKLQAAKIRAKQFFLLRCYTNAYQINDPNIKGAFDQLSKQLLPPRNITDAIVLASCGEEIVPYLKYQPWLKATEKAACVRTLGLIGDAQANNLLNDYLNNRSLTVVQELVNFVDDWSQILVIKGTVNAYGNIPVRIPRKLLYLTQLSNLTNLTLLNLSQTQVSDVSALANLTSLTTLYLGRTHVSDISALANLTSLTTLHLGGTQVSDVSALANLTNLTTLYLGGTHVSDISALANLTNLTRLDLWGTQVSDISALANLTHLTKLDLELTQVNNISALANLTSLSTLDLGGTQVSDISALANLKTLTTLILQGTEVSDISALANLTNLTTLHLGGTNVSDFSALANLARLQTFQENDWILHTSNV
jgi:hypothetical protein